MYFQQRYLEQNKAFIGQSGLATIDLPNKGLLSCVQLEVAAIAGTTVGKRDVGPIDALEKLELIVNGSKVVKSLTGRQVKGLMMYQKMDAGQSEVNNVYLAGFRNRGVLFINLGRHYHDLDYMLDLSKVSDPEVRLTYNFDLTSQDGWTDGEAQSSPIRDVICHLLRESAITPKGYIKTSEIYRYTHALSKAENMIVPRGPVYSNLYLESHYKDSGMQKTLDTMEVNIDNGRLIPMRLAFQQLVDILYAKWGHFRISTITATEDGHAIPPLLEKGVGIPSIWGEGEGIMLVVPSLDSDSWYLRLYNANAVVHPGTAKVQILYDGILPFSIAPIPLFDPWDERTWINSAELGDFWVRYEGANSGSTSCIIKLLADEVVTSY